MSLPLEHPSPYLADPAVPPVRRVKLIAVCVLVALGYWLGREWLRWDFLAQHESDLRELQRQFPLLTLGLAAGIYVLVTALSIPGSLILAFLYAWYFGFWPAAIVVSFASTAGATGAFWISRYFFRDHVTRRLGGRLATLQATLDREGAYLLLTLRLLPTVPFVFVNAAMGLTTISTRTFWWVSQVGMLPATLIYCYAGSRIPTLEHLAKNGIAEVLSPSQWMQCAAALTLLATFPWLARWAVIRATARRDRAKPA